MAGSQREKLAAIRKLINVNKIAEARRRLARVNPPTLDRCDRGFYFYLQSRLDYVDGNFRIANVNRAIKLLQPYSDIDELYYWSLFVKGVFHRRSHRFKASTAIFQQLKKEAAQAGHFHIEASATGQLARHLAAKGQFRRADYLFAKAIERYHFEAVRHHRRDMIHNRALWLARYGRFEQSKSILLADPVSVDELKGDMGATYTVNRAFDLALCRKTDEALDLLDTYYSRTSPNALDRHAYYLNKGVALLIANRLAEGLECLEEALALATKMRHETISTNYKWLAVCFVRMNMFAPARYYARLTLRLAKNHDEPFEIAGAHYVLGYADAVQLGKRASDKAQRHFIRSLQVSGKIDARWDLAMTQYAAAHLGVFDARQSSRLVRLAERYFRSEGITPPVKDCDARMRVVHAIRELGDDDRDRLLRLLDLD